MWKEEGKLRRIDPYWRDIFHLTTRTGKEKYIRLGRIVKGVLALPHLNADVERGLSGKKQMLTKDRVNLSRDSTIGNILTKEALKIHDPKQMRPECVPFTKELISYVKSSYRVYTERIKEERQKREEEYVERKHEEERNKPEKEKQAAAKEKEFLNEKKNRLNEKEKNYREGLHAAEELLQKGNDKLAAALKK